MTFRFVVTRTVTVLALVASAIVVSEISAAAGTTPPALQIVSPADGSTAPAATMAVTGTASDAGSGLKTMNVRIREEHPDGSRTYWNGTTWQTDSIWNTANRPGDGTWNVPDVAFAEGEFSIRALAIDFNGNRRVRTADYTTTASAGNSAPVAGDDSDSTAFETPVSVVVLANDTDVDGDLDASSVNVTSGPGSGSATVEPGGSILYTPSAGFAGADSFTYEVCDSEPLCDSADVAVAVADQIVNSPPVAVDDSSSTSLETPVSIVVLANDTDVDGDLDPASVNVTSGPGSGSVTVESGGSILYTPNAGFAGADSFTYEVCDSEPLCDSADVAVTVTPPSGVCTVDGISGAEDLGIGGTGPTEFVGDPVGDLDRVRLRIRDNGPPTRYWTGTSWVAASTWHEATVLPDGSWEYGDADLPESTFAVRVVTIKNNGSRPAYTFDYATTSTISCAPTNSAPVATDDTVTTSFEAAVDVDVLDNDSDIDGNLDPASVSVTSPAASGSATPNGDNTIRYQPNPGFSGLDSFTYEVCDAEPLCDTAVVSVTVDPAPNTAPDAVDDSVSTPFETPVSVDVLTNDIDVEGDIVFTSVVVTVPPASGSAVPQPDGSILYTPDAGFDGPDTFTYEVCDGEPLCDTAVVTVTVDPAVNTAPDAVDDSASTPFETAVSVDVLTNDVDVEGDIVFTSVVVTVPAGSGSAVPQPDGSILYTPDAGFDGPDTFTYEVCDDEPLCDTAVVSVTVDPAVNTAPDAMDDSVSTPFDTAVSVDVLTNDIDVEGDIVLTSVAVTVPPASGSAVPQPDGSILYTPDAGFDGPDTFTYEVCDGEPLCDTAVVTVTVDPAVNTAPDAVDDSASTPFETAVSVDVLTNDVDVEGDIVFTSVVVTVPAGSGSAVPQPDGSILYTPDAGFDGPDTFTYEVCDDEPLCDTAVVSVTVDPAPNTAPDAMDDSVSTPFDTAVSVDVLTNDIDVEGDIVLTSVAVTVPPASGSAVPQPDGSILYTPDAGFDGPDTFTYEVCDGEPLCDTAVVSVTVDPAPNTAPDAVDDSVSTPFETAVSVDVLTNDVDVEGDIVFTSVVVTVPAGSGSAVPQPDGSILYTPNLGFDGPDTFTYEVCDGEPLCDTAVVTVTVDPLNTPPDAVDDSASTPFETPISVDVLTNDIDLEGDVDLSSLMVTIDPASGTAIEEVLGTILYTPNTGFDGVDSFTYQLCDTAGQCDTALVSVTVDPAPNTAPDAMDDSVSTPFETAVSVDVLTNDVDVEGDIVFTSVVVTVPAGSGSAVPQPDGSILYTPNLGFDGPDTFTYEVCDGEPLCDTAVVTVTVDPLNTPPDAVDDSASTPFETPISVDVLTNDIDLEGDVDLSSLMVTIDPASGTAIEEVLGTILYTPNTGFDGVDSFTYQLCDTAGQCDTALVSVTVDPAPNTAPDAMDDSVSTPFETPISVDVLTNDVDVEGDIVFTSVVVTVPAGSGSAVPQPDGSILYTPNLGFDGTDTFTYEVCDGEPLCDTAVVAVTVESENTAPDATDDVDTVIEDLGVLIDVLSNDVDVEGDLDVSSVNVTIPPVSGSTSVVFDGSILYTPNAGFVGADTFTYEVCDDQPACDTAVVTVTVDPAPNNPCMTGDPTFGDPVTLFVEPIDDLGSGETALTTFTGTEAQTLKKVSLRLKDDTTGLYWNDLLQDWVSGPFWNQLVLNDTVWAYPPIPLPISEFSLRVIPRYTNNSTSPYSVDYRTLAVGCLDAVDPPIIPVRTTKAPVIKHGGDKPRLDRIVDGGVFLETRANAMGITGTLMRSLESDDLNVPLPIDEVSLASAMANVNPANIPSVTQNFYITYAVPARDDQYQGLPDFTDDVSWGVVADNWGAAANAAKNSGYMVGISIDTETYSATWDWPSTTEVAPALVYQRGAEVGQHIAAAWDDAIILSLKAGLEDDAAGLTHMNFGVTPPGETIGTTACGDFQFSGGNPTSNRGHFAAGLVKGLEGSNALFVDAGQHYVLRSASEFSCFYDYTKNVFPFEADTIPAADVANYIARTRVSFGIATTNNTVSSGFRSMDPATMEATLAAARCFADDFVWVWSRSTTGTWWTLDNNVTSPTFEADPAWINAVSNSAGDGTC